MDGFQSLKGIKFNLNRDRAIIVVRIVINLKIANKLNYMVSKDKSCLIQI